MKTLKSLVFFILFKCLCTFNICDTRILKGCYVDFKCHSSNIISAYHDE